jgi:hypothetical protein
MHSLNHPAYGRAVTAERARASARRRRGARSQHPPPARSRAAFAVARLARRLDHAAARRAVA